MNELTEQDKNIIVDCTTELAKQLLATEGAASMIGGCFLSLGPEGSTYWGVEVRWVA